MSGLLLGVLALISGGQRYTEDQVTMIPLDVEGFGGGGAGVRNGDVISPEPTYTVIEPIGISKVSTAEIITSTTLPAAGRIEFVDSGDIEVITPIGKKKYIKTIIPAESLSADVWREEAPVYRGRYQVL